MNCGELVVGILLLLCRIFVGKDYRADNIAPQVISFLVHVELIAASFCSARLTSCIVFHMVVITAAKTPGDDGKRCQVFVDSMVPESHAGATGGDNQTVPVAYDFVFQRKAANDVLPCCGVRVICRLNRRRQHQQGEKCDVKSIHGFTCL